MKDEPGIEVRVVNQAAIATSNGENSFVARLAQFFPGAMRVRIPVRVCPISSSKAGEADSSHAENTVLEFGTSREVLFASTLILDFEDKVRLKNADGSLDAEASVVAVQLGEGKAAVAVRFTGDVANWIIKR